MAVPHWVFVVLLALVFGGLGLAGLLSWLFRKNKAAERRIFLCLEIGLSSIFAVVLGTPVVVGLFTGETGFQTRGGTIAHVLRDGKWPEVYWALQLFWTAVVLFLLFVIRRGYRELRYGPLRLSNSTAESDARRDGARGSP